MGVTGRLISLERVRHALFVRTDRLGETLLNLPAIAALRAALPAASLTMLVGAHLQPLIEEIPWIDRVMAYDEGSWRLWWVRAGRLGRRLRAQPYDLAVVSNPKKELHIAVWLAGIPIRVGYDRKWGGCLTHRLQDRKALGERHEVEYNLDLVRAIGVPAIVPDWPMFELAGQREEGSRPLAAHGIGASEPFVALHPWTSNPVKQWPVERFRRLICEVADRAPGLAIVLIGGPEEAERVPEVIPEGIGRVINLTDRLSLTQLAVLLERARVLISNDSGPVHLAAAVNTPTIALFGSTHPATGPVRWGPWGAGQTVICRPSMESITVDDVMAALTPFLNE